MACPANAFRFNSTLCACDPGYLLNATANTCNLFESSHEEWISSSGIDYSFTLSVPIFSLDSIKKYTTSQAVFLHATIVLLLSWLLFCFAIRFRKLGDDGSSIWFRIRWWISRLDICYATRHWLEDQKVVRKRKTELGGTFSIASWILFIGLLATLIYQMVSRRNVEVHSVRAINGPELLSFDNDMEFNITAISSMSCSHLRGLGTMVTGIEGSVDYRTAPLSTFANYSCHNTSRGPTVMIKCSNCKLARDYLHISWHFVDLPNDPATAVGFQFNFTSHNRRDRKRKSMVTGIVRNGSNTEDRAITFRGPEVNILKFNLFPRIYRHLNDLRLVQPLFHEFIPGSSFTGTGQLQDSLQRPQDGLINTTLAVNFLSAYVIEVDTENVFGPVSFFADLGGLYAVCFAIFFYFLMQCEYRIKKLRHEDTVLQNIRTRTKAKQNWDKLRKYVMYTWGCSLLEDANETNGEDLSNGCMTLRSFRGSGSVHKRNRSIQLDTISLNKKSNLPNDKNTFQKPIQSERVKAYSDLETGLIRSDAEQIVGHKDQGKETGKRSESSVGSVQSHAEVPRPKASLPKNDTLPPPPVLEYKTGPGADISDIHKNLQNLYEYNVLLREKFIASQSEIEALRKKASDQHCKCLT